MIASTSISSSVTPRYSIRRRGIDFEILQLRLGVAPAVGLDEADHDVEAAGRSACASLQHLVGLADAGRRADVDAQPGPLRLLDRVEQRVGAMGALSVIASLLRSGDALVEREVEQQHVDARFAEEAELPSFGVRLNELAHLGLRTCRARGPRGHLEVGRGRA